MTPRKDVMHEAMRLMQTGDLQAATRTLQHALGGGAGQASPHPAGSGTGDTAANGPCIEGEFRVIDDGEASPAEAPFRAPGAGDVSDARHRLSCDAGELEYRLHIPEGLDTAGAPLLVMLHGCTQTPEDFARGTRMNRLADEHGYVVAWPAQSALRNQNRCWNWFRGSDQQRGKGEPEILAALTRQLVATHRLDAGRVYVAGLSAGGAMAAVLASTYPDVYAAIGVHSGLPTGLASDMPSAFAAMRKGGGPGRCTSASGTRSVPAIVFHGDSDATVHPDNGHGVIEQSLASGGGLDAAARSTTVERDIASGGRSFTRTVHRNADARIAAEHWVIHGAGHAWAGGDTAGTYADPQGPDASAHMLRFFAAL
ncbi:extracellular catalytic domain type 1 short-chain-length polyhydroxyalkanoate depolymerase [Luteimonas sp. A478]